MNLTDFTDYSLRVLIYLNQTKELKTLTEISEELGISRNHLIKISNKLVKLGYVEATRGRTGGLRIHDAASKMSLGAIVRKTEGRVYLAECFSDQKINCSLQKRCSLKGYLSDAFEAFIASLDRHTLDDITPKR